MVANCPKAAVFRPGQTPVIGRFSLAGGNPFMADTPSAARGLGLAFGFPGATQWRTAMLNTPVFLDNSPQGFYRPTPGIESRSGGRLSRIRR